MSYSSYGYIPYLDNYTEAFKVFSTTEPIRGSKPVRVPLGRRQDSTKFGISKDLNGDIHLSLYGHTGIVFHADNHTLTIGDTSGKRHWRWSSCDSYFILSVLGRYIKNARTDRGRLVLETRDDQKFVLESKGNLTLTYTIGNADQPIHNRTRTLTPVSSSNPVLHTYRLNRQATNNVRARYGEFYRYMKGLIGVRKELKVSQYFNYRDHEIGVLSDALADELFRAANLQRQVEQLQQGDALMTEALLQAATYVQALKGQLASIGITFEPSAPGVPSVQVDPLAICAFLDNALGS